ncbi:MAG: hypothetical protein BWY49_00445 [Candidatus Omnitrophica bacterium ADurb.Bin314]|nr:MAG: hypothetical protein BWY49_00445 [Candidatus Omnitrophica bacterium ADurb.Bin314]
MTGQNFDERAREVFPERLQSLGADLRPDHVIILHDVEGFEVRDIKHRGASLKHVVAVGLLIRLLHEPGRKHAVAHVMVAEEVRDTARVEAAGDEYRGPLSARAHDGIDLFVEHRFALMRVGVERVGGLIEGINPRAERRVRVHPGKNGSREPQFRTNRIRECPEVADHRVYRDRVLFRLDLLPVTARKFEVEKFTDQFCPAIEFHKLPLSGRRGQLLKNLHEKPANLGKKRPGIKFAPEDQITGVGRIGGIIAEPETVRARRPGKFFEQKAGLNAHGAVRRIFARDADILILEVLNVPDQLRGQTFRAQKTEKLFFFRRGAGRRKFFLDILEYQEARDLRPLHLGEQAFEIKFERLIRLPGEGTDIGHEFPLSFFKLFPLPDHAAEVVAGNPGRDRFEARVEFVHVAARDRFRAEHFPEGLVVLPVELRVLDAVRLHRCGVSAFFSVLLTPHFVRIFQEKQLRSRQAAVFRELIREQAVAFVIGKILQTVGIKFRARAFHEDRVNRIGLVQVFEKFLDFLLGAVVGVSVLDVKDQTRFGNRRSLIKLIKRREF